jgi:hypothetical protein
LAAVTVNIAERVRNVKPVVHTLSRPLASDTPDRTCCAVNIFQAIPVLQHEDPGTSDIYFATLQVRTRLMRTRI